MKVSKTEMTSLLKQVFEALGFHVGEHESAAEMLVWAQMHGLRGFPELQQALPRLVDQDRPPPLELISEEDDRVVLDACGGSVLNCADVVMGLACARALSNDLCCVVVHNCHDRKLIIKAVTDCSRGGMCSMAYWRAESSPDTAHLIWLEADVGVDGLPNYTAGEPHVKCTIDTSESQSLFFLCSRDAQSWAQRRSSILSDDPEPLTIADPEKMGAHYQKAISDGLSIDEDLWRRLQLLARRVLVESSEQSRHGAGA